MTGMTPTDRRMIANLTVVRAGIEAINTVLFTDDELDDADIERGVEQFVAGRDMIRRILPDHVLDQVAGVQLHDPPTRPALSIIPPDNDPEAA